MGLKMHSRAFTSLSLSLSLSLSPSLHCPSNELLLSFKEEENEDQLIFFFQKKSNEKEKIKGLSEEGFNSKLLLIPNSLFQCFQF